MSRHPTSRDGAALVTVLGILTVLTILAVAFTLVMRLESTGARRHADRIRAQHYTEVGLGRVLETLGVAMYSNYFSSRVPYPYWGADPPSYWAHAFASFSTNRSDWLSNETNLFTGYVTNLIPASLHTDFAAITSSWLYVIGVDPQMGNRPTSTNGRVAYLAVNLSGLLDVNAMQQSSDEVRATDAGVFDPDAIFRDSEFAYQDALLDNRDELHRRYETQQELLALNQDWLPHAMTSNLFVYSYDPNPHVYMVDTNDFGMRSADLEAKFNLNAITNYADTGYSGGKFTSEYFDPLVAHLTAAGISNATETAWNVVAFLEPGHTPLNDESYPWREDYGGQAVPLINEISLQKVPETEGETNNAYRVHVELWYPFAPGVITEADGYRLHVYVFSKQQREDMSIFSIVQPNNIEKDWSFSREIGSMMASENSEFKEFQSHDSELIAFPETYTIGEEEHTTYLPLGVHWVPADPPYFITNHVWLLTRVTRGAAHDDRDEAVVVDEALSRKFEPDASSWALPVFDAPRTYAVIDPRMNTDTNNWVVVDEDEVSLGAINPITILAMTNGTQGLPIVHLNNVATNIVDIGQVHVSGQPWQSIDLFDPEGGALLLDRLTLTPTNDTPWQSGRVNLNSQHVDVLRSLLTFDSIPQPIADGATDPIGVDSDQLHHIAMAIVTNAAWPYRRMADMFHGTNGGPVATAMRALGDSSPTGPTSYQQQYALRYLVDKTTTRENLIGIILAGQALSPDGRMITADYREFVLVMRDAWTGNWFVKQRFVLDDW